MENTSGRGDAAVLPEEIRGWNWGGFLLNWAWWGFNGPKWMWFVGSLVLNMILPVVGIVLSIMLGLKGNEWAWRNRAWESVEQFKRVQRKWALWGFGFWAVLIAIPIAAVVWLMSNKDDTKKNADAPPTITRAVPTPAPKAPAAQPAGAATTNDDAKRRADAPPTVTGAASTPAPQAAVGQPVVAPTKNMAGSSESASSSANTNTTLQDKPGLAQIAAPAAARTNAFDAEARAKAKEEQDSRRRTALAHEQEATRQLKAKQSECVYKPVMTDEDLAKCR